jgi:voltage-gated potassium channel Kch
MTAHAASVPPSSAGEAGPLVEQPAPYDLFIGLMTLLSVVVMILASVVRVDAVDTILTSTDTLFCVVFLLDFAHCYRRAPSKRTYLFGDRPGRSIPNGLFDLLGSIPGSGLLRALRLVRVARLARAVRAHGSRGLAAAFFKERAESAAYVIILAAFLVLLMGSSLIAAVEPTAEGSNIEDAGDAFWWAFVTITTVGYGDRFPVTEAGRFVGMVTMAVGIGIFGVLTSFLSTWFLKRPEGGGRSDDLGGDVRAMREELLAVRAELAGVRRLLEVDEHA